MNIPLAEFFEVIDKLLELPGDGRRGPPDGGTKTSISTNIAAGREPQRALFRRSSSLPTPRPPRSGRRLCPRSSTACRYSVPMRRVSEFRTPGTSRAMDPVRRCGGRRGERPCRGRRLVYLVEVPPAIERWSDLARARASLPLPSEKTLLGARHSSVIFSHKPRPQRKEARQSDGCRVRIAAQYNAEDPFVVRHPDRRRIRITEDPSKVERASREGLLDF